MEHRDMQVALVTHFWVNYRLPIVRLLCGQRPPAPQYTIVSGRKPSNSTVPLIDTALAQTPISEGGLRWKFVRNHWFCKHFLWQSRVKPLFRAERFDAAIITGVQYHLSTWSSLRWLRRRGVRTLMWTHGFLHNETGLKGRLRERFYRQADGLLLYGHHARNILIDKGFDPDRLYVVYNSLDYDAQVQLRESIGEQDHLRVRRELFGGRADEPILLWVGRLLPSKRLDMMIEAAAALGRRGVACNLLMIGAGEQERRRLGDLADRLGLAERVLFFGPCYEERKLAEMIGASDVCVAPGAIGLTCMHSLAYGTPVITHDDPGRQGPEWQAVTEGVTGALFRCGDTDDLTATLAKWFESDQDRQVTRRRCYEVIDRYYNPHHQAEILNAAVEGIPASQAPYQDGPGAGANRST